MGWWYCSRNCWWLITGPMNQQYGYARLPSRGAPQNMSVIHPIGINRSVNSISNHPILYMFLITLFCFRWMMSYLNCCWFYCCPMIISDSGWLNSVLCICTGQNEAPLIKHRSVLLGHRPPLELRLCIVSSATESGSPGPTREGCVVCTGLGMFVHAFIHVYVNFNLIYRFI